MNLVTQVLKNSLLKCYFFNNVLNSLLILATTADRAKILGHIFDKGTKGVRVEVGYKNALHCAK